MSFLGSLNVSASGLTAQRLRMDVISENIANVNTTRTEDGTPYKRKVTLFEQRGKSSTPFSQYFQSATASMETGGGVRVSRIVKDESAGIKTYDPSHPVADAEGYVTGTNVNIVQEMVNMISASRSYEANVTALNATKAMISKTLEISAR